MLGRLLMASAVALAFQTSHAEPSDKATVYQEAGKNRVHMDGCRRLTPDEAERAKHLKMTLAEAKAKGLELCSKCPGSRTPGDDEAEEPQPKEDKEKKDPTVYQEVGKNRVHVDGCRRLTDDPAERAKLAKMTLAEAKAKGLELCSKCPGSTTPGEDQSKQVKDDTKTTVYQAVGKNRVHVEGCSRLTQDPAERAKLVKMTLAEAKAKGLELCSKCPGSSTPGKGNPEGGDGGLESWVKPAPDANLFEQQLNDRISSEKGREVQQSLVVGNQPAAPQETAKEIFEDNMEEDWQKNWFLDGKHATLEHRDGGLYFAGGTVTKEQDPKEYHAHHAAIWTKQVFEGDLRISYLMKRVDKSDYGNTLLYIQAQGIGTPPYVEDIHAWRQLRDIPDMSIYFTYMDLLSLSFREDIRCKRYPLRDVKLVNYANDGLLEPKLDYPGLTPGATYQVLVEKTGESLRLRLFDDSGENLQADHTWDTSRIDEGIEPRQVRKGRIGIRHMATKQFIYRNFKVEQILTVSHLKGHCHEIQ